MRKAIILIALIFIFAFPQKVMAEDTVIKNTADMFNLDDADRDLKRISSEYEIEGFSLKDTVLKMVSGEYDFSLKNVLKTVLDIAVGQAGDVLYIMKRIIILVLLTSVLEMISGSFSSSGVSKMGQYACSAVMIITIMQSFYYASDMAVQAVNDISETSTTLQPLYVLIMTAEGKAAKMTAAMPVLYSAATVLNHLVKKFVVPGIMFSALMTFINSMSERDILMEFANLISSLCKWSVKGCAGVFMFIMSIIKIGVPSTGLMVGKSIKTAAEAVPVAGSLMSSAAETAASITMAMGNSITAAIMMFIVFISIVPIIRLGMIMLIYKVTAAAIEPVASKRIVRCISQAADYASIFTGLVFTSEVMFITVTALLLSV